MRWLLLISALTLGAAEARKPVRTELRVTTLDQQDPPLDKAAFRATLDGNPARVIRVRGPKDDLILLVVLDLTGDLNLVDTAREALTARIEGLPRNFWTAVLKAQDGLQVIVDPTADRPAASTAIKEYPATGKAGLLDTLQTAASLGDAMLQRTNVRVAMLYVTDSNIYNYREDFTNPVINSSDSRDLSRRFPDQLIREKILKLSDTLAATETPLFFIHLNYASDPINEAYQRGLLQLAEQSGGTGAFCRSRGEIAEAVEKVFDAASSHWSLAVELRNHRARTATVDVFNADRDIPNRARFVVRR
ncbi:MAG: hypothetical protein FJW30_14735 [Acidobacteria bacterium]|nr:hypothetical protein [Acidobacteriota bacterium]